VVLPAPFGRSARECGRADLEVDVLNRNEACEFLRQGRGSREMNSPLNQLPLAPLAGARRAPQGFLAFLSAVPIPGWSLLLSVGPRGGICVEIKRSASCIGGHSGGFLLACRTSLSRQPTHLCLVSQDSTPGR